MSDQTEFDSLVALDDLLSEVGLSSEAPGGTVSIIGRDPILPAVHRLGACIGIPLMAAAIAAVRFHRERHGPTQDLALDLRKAVHTINPGAFWQPTLNGEPAPHPLVVDNPFLIVPYRTSDGRFVMASGVYPHMVAAWCRFLDVPPDPARVAAAISQWDSFDIEEAANALGLPISVIRTPAEWLSHEQGALLSTQPVIGLERIGDAPPKDFGPAERAFVFCRSPTPSPVQPSVGPWPSTARTSSVPLDRTTTNTSSSTPKRMSARAAPTSTSTLPSDKHGRPLCWPTPTLWSTTTAAAH
jgi:hypothetical protein